MFPPVTLVKPHAASAAQIAALEEIVGDADTMRAVGNGKPWTRQKIADLVAWSKTDDESEKARDYYYWLVCQPGANGAPGAVVGIVGLHPMPFETRGMLVSFGAGDDRRVGPVDLQIFIVIGKNHRGQHYGPGAMVAMLQRHAPRGLRIWSLTAAGNTPAAAAMIAAGFAGARNTAQIRVGNVSKSYNIFAVTAAN